MSLTKLSLGGNNFYMTSLFPPRDRVSDIPAGDGSIEKLFYGVLTTIDALVEGKWIKVQDLLSNGLSKA
jgi:hypothetical protein